MVSPVLANKYMISWTKNGRFECTRNFCWLFIIRLIFGLSCRRDNIAPREDKN